jgi:bifunctional non-homologous end joining protein LigD
VAGKAREVDVEGRRISLTNLDKVLYPTAGFTKGEVIDYYARIADQLLPHLSGRPLTLVRYPDGVEAGHFFEKRCPGHRPGWVATTPVWSGREAGKIDYCVCDDRPTLVWMAQLAALELHPSLSLGGAIESPTVLVFDLDPGAPATIVECAQVALRVREMLGELGLECYPKTSGSKGMQVYAPLNVEATYGETKPFAQAIARLLERSHPDLVVSRMAKRLRRGKVLVDWSQNDRAKTTVAVYSLRARERPTASTPLDWDEVTELADDGDPDAVTFEAGELLERVGERGDLFAPVLELRQDLPALA